MRKVKVIISFSHLSVPELVELARNIVTKMTDNANFATPLEIRNWELGIRN
jgi:hypothetical protein